MSSRAFSLVMAVVAVLYALLLWWLEKGYPLQVLALFAGSAAALALISAVHAALREQAEDEARQAIDAPVDANALFRDDAAARVQGRNLQQYEKYFVPSLTVLVALLEATLGVYLWQQLRHTPLLPSTTGALVTAAVLLVAAVLWYVGGSVVAGLAFRGGKHGLRAVAGEACQLAWLSGALGAVTLLRFSALPRLDTAATVVLLLLLLLRAGEKLLAVVLEAYRPRRGDEALRLLYESRVAALFADPQGVLRNLAETLHYQFGVEVSEAAVWRVLRFGLPGLLLLELAVLALLSCVVVINPGEQALVERLGTPLGTPPVLQPGLHLQLPWPIDTVYRVRVSETRTLLIGLKPGDAAPPPPGKPAPADVLDHPVPKGPIPRLWTDKPELAGELFLTANRAAGGSQPDAATRAGAGDSLDEVAVIVTVQYRVTDVARYLTVAKDTPALLQQLARRELVACLAGHELSQLLGSDADAVANELRDHLRAVVAPDHNGLNLGVEILTAGWLNLQPPVPTVDGYFDVIAAKDNKLEMTESAKGAALMSAASAAAESGSILADARAYRYGREQGSAAEVQSYTGLLTLYHTYPQLFRERRYLEALETGLRGKRKLIIATEHPDQVISVDLKDPVKTDLLNLATPP